MKRSILKWQIVGFIFTSILGVVLHFLFDWTNQNIIVSSFAAVNESIFEHMKLLFFPMFLFSLVQSRFIGKEYSDFWCVKLLGIVLGVLLIPVLYYTINGIFGLTPDWVNIAIFFISALASYYVETKLFMKKSINCKSPVTALVILCLIALLFMIWTFKTPQIPFFKDPITGTFGYYKLR